jgi:hypothetical protein
METEESQLIKIYHDLVDEWMNCTTNSGYIIIMAKINGGNNMKPGILFNHITGKLKSKKKLKVLTYNHLSLIFKSNTLNSENSKMLTSNMEDFDSQEWFINTLPFNIIDYKDTQWRIALFSDTSVALNVFFNRDFSLSCPKKS